MKVFAKKVWFNILATPKSPTRTSSSFFKKIFKDFKSRCNILSLCISANPNVIFIKYFIIKSSLNKCLVFI